MDRGRGGGQGQEGWTGEEGQEGWTGVDGEEGWTGAGGVDRVDREEGQKDWSEEGGWGQSRGMCGKWGGGQEEEDGERGDGVKTVGGGWVECRMDRLR